MGAADPEAAEEGPGAGAVDEDAALARERGAPLLAALEHRLPGAQARGEIAARVGVELAAAVGRPPGEAALIAEAARLHEVGKLYVEAGLLGRPATDLEPAERTRLAEHPEHGHAVALGAGVPAAACAWLLHARERWDGQGPTGLGGGDIPLGARIVAVAREYVDAPVEAGPGLDPQQAAVAHLRRLAGSVLDPGLAETATAMAGG